jgi:hypothetical protein
MDTFRSCLRSADTQEVLDNALAAFAQSESRGTPSLFINEQRVDGATLTAVNGQINAIMTTADPVPVEIVEEVEATEEVEVTEEAETTEEVEATEEAEMTEEAEATEEAANLTDTLGDLDAGSDGN